MTQQDTQQAAIGILPSESAAAVQSGTIVGVTSGLATSVSAQALMISHIAAADPHTQYQKESEKNIASGYAGLNAVSRVTMGIDVTDYIIIHDNTKGYVFKDDNTPPHYWKQTVTSAGAVVTTDLGIVSP